jgi:predicted lipid-binding transport protein (Tim44 family)
MSRYILIHRLRGPAILLLIGVLALLYQAGAITYFWGLFWPLLLILMGAIMLAERAALANEGYPPAMGTPYQSAYYSGAPQPPASQPAQTSAPSAETAIVPTRPHDLMPHDFDPNGGRQ